MTKYTLGTNTALIGKIRQGNVDIDALAKAGAKYLTRLVQDMKTDYWKSREMGTTLFGFGLEAFYIYAKTGLAVGTTEDFSSFLLKNIPLLQILKDHFDSLTLLPVQDSRATRYRYFETNSGIIEAILDILQKSKGKPTEADLRAIIAIVEKPRTRLLAVAK